MGSNIDNNLMEHVSKKTKMTLMGTSTPGASPIIIALLPVTTASPSLSATGSANTATTTTATTLNPLTDDNLLRHILSYVGSFRYRFVAVVNRRFHDMYCSIYPCKNTFIKTSTIGELHVRWDDFAVEEFNYGVTKSAQQRLLWKATVRCGNAVVVDYLHNLLSDDGHTCCYDTCMEIAMKYNHLSILMWLSSNGSSLQMANVCYLAAKYGRLEILRWACDVGHASKEDRRVCQYALGNGHMVVLHWATNNGFIWDTEDNVTCFQTSLIAAENGKLEALKWLRSNGCRMSRNDDFFEGDDSCYNRAVRYGHFEVLEWLRRVGFSWNCATADHAIDYAFETGNLKMLRSIFDHGFPDGGLYCYCSKAAMKGDIKVLEIIRSYDCPWNETTCAYASRWGHLEVLKWLHANGCPWDEVTTDHAASVEIYNWAVSNGCPASIVTI